ncbi:hypothetical protein LIER_24360 [Lithospermum erythrorhizon]|uniref:mRNA export factor GLE1 n=1 Tax=Lithospermum erythrorhizon TaxID=34254 RepID=A0AAV3R514_LITER
MRPPLRKIAFVVSNSFPSDCWLLICQRLAELEAEKVKEENVAREEAERTAAREAAVKNASEKSVEVASLESSGQPTASQSNTAGNTVRRAGSALRLEEQSLQTFKELTAFNETLGIGTNKLIVRTIKQISGTRVSITTLNNPSTPQSASMMTFAEKFVLYCEIFGDFDNKLYAYARIIVSITSQVPQAMEILIPELNRVCIFTVPSRLLIAEKLTSKPLATKKKIRRLILFWTVLKALKAARIRMALLRVGHGFRGS